MCNCESDEKASVIMFTVYLSLSHHKLTEHESENCEIIVWIHHQELWVNQKSLKFQDQSLTKLYRFRNICEVNERRD